MNLLKDLLRDLDDIKTFNLVVKNSRRCYSGLMPKKYGIFPQQPDVYILSKCICLEFPSWGSIEYRYELSELRNKLCQNFYCDVQYFDGKTTFILKKIKE